MEKRIIIDGQESNYVVTDKGEIFNVKTGRQLKVNKNGAVQLNFKGANRGRMVARLVAEFFIPNPNPEIYVSVMNIDGDKTNNNVDNIKWITASENCRNAWDTRRKNYEKKSLPKKKNENIVEKSEKFTIQENERRIFIDGEETPYVITKEGVLRNLKTGNILKGSMLGTYPSVNLRWNGKQKNKSFHRLVAETWIPNPKNLPVVDHIDGDRTNYHADNLRWVDHITNSNNIHKDKTPKKEDIRPIFTEEELKNESWMLHESTGLQVSNLGRVKGFRGDLVNGTIIDSGYIGYAVGRGKVLGHLLVWETFNGQSKPENMVVNHKNGNKMDNRLSNLELVSQKENMQKAAAETNVWNFRKVVEVDAEGNILREFANASDAARAIGIEPGSMRNSIRRNGRCYNGLYYKYVEN